LGRKPFRTADEKLAVVLSVLKGETTQVEAARRLQMSQTTIAKWQKRVPRGRPRVAGPRRDARGPTSRREDELAAQIEDLTTARGEAYVDLRVWRKKGRSTHVRRARADPGRRQGLGRALLRPVRDPTRHLVLLADRSAPRPPGPSLAGAGRRSRRAGRVRDGAQVLSMGPPQDLGDAARRWGAGQRQQRPGRPAPAPAAAAGLLSGRAPPAGRAPARDIPRRPHPPQLLRHRTGGRAAATLNWLASTARLPPNRLMRES
jgi:transposase